MMKVLDCVLKSHQMLFDGTLAAPFMPTPGVYTWTLPDTIETLKRKAEIFDVLIELYVLHGQRYMTN